jgi:hypothetical protein
MITGVLTSCGRHDLLERTMQSFFDTDPKPLERLIVVEDGPDISQDLPSRFAGMPVEWISTGTRVGQIAAIDYAYSRVKTPYVFHLEDDWFFYRSGFMEKSLLILQAYPKCLQVQLRAVDDLKMGHPILEHIHTIQGIAWRQLAYDHFSDEGDWHGFSFNPGLRRLSDYIAIGGYGVHHRFDMAIPWLSESTIGKRYRERDFFVSVLADNNGAGYVRHTGDDRHVNQPSETSP